MPGGSRHGAASSLRGRRASQERRNDTERVGTVGIIIQEVRKIIDRAKLAFAATV